MRLTELGIQKKVPQSSTEIVRMAVVHFIV